MRGIKARGNTIQIDFYFERERCRETIRIPPTDKNMRFAAGKRAAIIHEIEMGRFDYAAHFPYSSRVSSRKNKKNKSMTVSEALDIILADAVKTCQRSTLKDYRSAVNCHLTPTFGKLLVSELNEVHIADWISTLNITRKRVSNVLIPLRLALENALADRIIDTNPLDRIKKLKRYVNLKESNDDVIDPFTLDEVKKILTAMNGQVRHFYQFAFATGLRTSELIALEWDDIDQERNIVRVRRAFVEKQNKVTKTPSGKREVALSSQALSALAAQKSYSLGMTEQIFQNPKTKRPWASDAQLRKTAWTPALKKADVKYRYPYQTRHTFASVALSAGEPEMWIASQLGHKDVTMVRKSYGRWLQGVFENAGKVSERAWRRIEEDDSPSP